MDTDTLWEKAWKLYGQFTGGGNDPGDPEPELSMASPTKPTEFNISRSWFDNFRRRFNLKSVSLRGEAISADKSTSEECVNETFSTTVEEGGYLCEQVMLYG